MLMLNKKLRRLYILGCVSIGGPENPFGYGNMNHLIGGAC